MRRIIFVHQGRRRSFDFEDISPMLNLENQENDYTKRRNTTDNENAKTRERNFIKRQIVLGNIEVGENSTEDMTLSMISGKHSSEDLSKSINDISDTIFKMDSLDMENSKVKNKKFNFDVAIYTIYIYFLDLGIIWDLATEQFVLVFVAVAVTFFLRIGLLQVWERGFLFHHNKVYQHECCQIFIC